ncbi:similar to Saccharomyces cerevisiae YMR159C ATG16 Conserved protein that interacts with Atg12p- Atg5p conjugates to form Atg12p-Atg5p-Atg16p multimers [Maudiozyma barnettii]|uniref:Similar to Saccharomyces cerevisiae YMR159C ATG16 Conserved protein that interacts with Atg12p- Atg5p conjugates to form Atg12p-Atg5p-Atg16p multimers n=1 Tax=Maudiozyma barnettii TaxID=61262 RepID=A0A8H2ZI12_9SACH|nr:Atg16p [Kazachstania barnettii]CAB4254493.1 similar to Saccharomyces cerevisiae YMR159C ATG16 Conserved protein that interacts with Atg12p- Atg5p conjugates to form Atg12p-Atg5p-Atg16p multimers [Kazachstania barnettii]CAD1782497.1 similar to Saccharomyces cerevisiae YMR159C ATG16 Conserved protein that interacts with Atg12p- Atg5p conjugates to form Atg12p-Atg5p-Atg16p multimers [Kazachstania barnettii]
MDRDTVVPVLIKKLRDRDQIQDHYNELFNEISPNARDDGTSSSSTTHQILGALKKENTLKDQSIEDLQERIEIMNKNIERLNDELISTNIENNILQDKFESLNDEYNKLVQRWLQKVQKEADVMNANVENINSSK